MVHPWAKILVAGAVLTVGISAGLSHFRWGGASFFQAEAQPVPDRFALVARRDKQTVELAAVDIVTVKTRTMTEVVSVSGELKLINRVILRSKAAGTVVEVGALPGQPVKAGEMLVRFDTEDLTANLAQMTSNLEGAQAELLRAAQTLTRVEQLVAKDIASKDRLEEAQGEVATARAKVRGLLAQIAIAQAAVNNAVISAPFDGVVASRAIEPGTTTAANAELMTVVDPSTLEAEVLVSTRDISRIEIGQTAELRIDGLEGVIFAGSVDRINPIANEGARMVPVYIGLANVTGRLWSGMFVSGSIQVDRRKDVFVLPSTALRKDGLKTVVLKLDDGTLVQQTVSVESRWNGGDDVGVSGLSVGEVVVAAPLPELSAGVPAIVTRAN